MTVRTRFAPSPTGRLHLGNIRTAVFSWLLARHHGGAFVLRIEDTDVGRNVEGGEAGILEDMAWLGLAWDEGPDIGGDHGPYRQSARDEKYADAVGKLIESGAAYPCFCSERELEETAEEFGEGRTALSYSGKCRALDPAERARRVEAGEEHVIRVAVPDTPSAIDIEDEIFGDISFPVNDIDDFVLRRSDGRVTYNFAVVVDDIDMRISHVVRGVGHLSNTPKQALLFDAFGAERPAFAHLPTVLGSDGKKLSKREGAAAVADLRAEGFPPDAVLNYLSLLGWSHPEEKEVLTRQELVDAMDLARVGKSDTQIDPEKLRWIASRHVASESLAELTAHVSPFIDTALYPRAPERLEAIVDTLRTRMSTYGDINEHLPLLFPPEEAAARQRETLGADPDVRRVLQAVHRRLSGVEEWTAEVLDGAVRAGGADAEAKGAALFHPVRALLIGSEKGPDLGKILAGIGKEEAFRRMGQALGEQPVL